MFDLGASISSASMVEFTKAIDRAERETRRTPQDAVEWAAINFVQSARTRSKAPPGRRSQAGKGEKHHKVEPNPEVGGAGRSQSGRYTSAKKYRIVILRQSGKKTYLYTNNKADKRRKIARAGLGWASWAMLLPKLGKSGSGGKLSGRASKSTTVQKLTAGMSPSITLRNKLEYISRDDPNLIPQSLMAAGRKMNKLLDNRGKKIKRRFAR